ncbi:tetratricopeptide repeat protein, partial [Okeania hirsuta]
QAAQAAPAWVLPYSNLAETHRKLRNYEKAEAAALKALAIDSNFAMAANNLGLIYFIQERDNEAKAYFEKAIAADSNYAATYYNLGNWHFWYKNYDIAEANLLKYNSLKPKDSQAYQLLGLVYQRWKKLEKSSLAFEESLRIDPTNATTTYNFGVLRYEQKRLEEAIGLFQRYQELEPKDTDVYLMLSYCYAGQGKKELVISTLEQLFVELEYDNLEVLEAREDLVEIRKLPEYKALIKRYFPDK